MPPATAEQLEARLAAGAWLRPGEVAKLFAMTRWAVDYWLEKGIDVDGERFQIRYRLTPGGWRECNPDDVTRILVARRTQHNASSAPPPSD